MIARAMLTAAALLLCGSVQAAEVKDILQHERQLLAGQCSEIEFYPGFIEMMDLNGDGREDAIIDYQYVHCDGATETFCGSGGCTLRLYSGSRNGAFAEAGEFLSYGLKLRGSGKKRRIAISVHGSACGKAGAASCTITGRLADGKFVIERKQ
ncbi:hypothetical protein [Hyphomicrobium sp. D-2]|uniref:hypothetical protein n=1 Tax=Hyphomicrobium sp. D-2 TaxID=3041621 RepID=UPI002454C0B2|nr:hypothetical protein [Hyphomicrobium sp. D-2]MDH4980716.1 hypothetical protein [Hyphomicrobium sp. D-2]